MEHVNCTNHINSRSGSQWIPFSAFMIPVSSSPRSQEPAFGPLLSQLKPVLTISHQFFNIHVIIILQELQITFFGTFNYEDKDIMFPRNVGICLRVYTKSKHRTNFLH